MLLNVITLILMIALLIGKANAADGIMVCRPGCIDGKKYYDCVDENGNKIKQYAYDKQSVPTKCESHDTD